MSSGYSGQAPPLLKSMASRRVLPRTRSIWPDRVTAPPASTARTRSSGTGAHPPPEGRKGAWEERRPRGRLRQQIGSIELVQRGPETTDPAVLRQASRCPIPPRPRVEPPFGPDLDLQRLV